MVSTCTPDATLRSVPAEELQSELDILERAFNVSVELWFQAGGWQPCLSRPTDQVDPVICRILAQTYDDSGPVVTALSVGRTLAVVPLAHPVGVRCAAVAELESSDQELVEQLARTALQTLNLSRQLDQSSQRLIAYADHVSQESEQLCWLQQLAAHIEICDPHLGLEAVAENVLPELQELIGAQEILLCSCADSAPAAGRTSAPPEHSILRFGHSDLLKSELWEIVDRLGRSARIQPAIGNHFGQGLGAAAVTRLHSYVLVPIATNADHFGWLLAVNKQRPAALSTAAPQLGSGESSEVEFGSIEGGLLKAAGILLAAHARNALLFRQKEALMVGIVRALINSIDAKDPYTFGHSDRVALLTKRLAQELGYDAQACERILLTGLLHDIGKIGVPDSVLQKPGKLTEAEFELIKKHPAVGYNILKHLDQLDYVLEGVLHHHESFDGRGYPQQLAGEEIPMVARIIAVADAYDAMTSCRPYRQAMPYETAEAILSEHAGKLWDAQVVRALFRALDDIHAICRTERAHAEHVLNGSRAGDDEATRMRSDLVGEAVTSGSQSHLFAAENPTTVPRDAEFHTTRERRFL